MGGLTSCSMWAGVSASGAAGVTFPGRRMRSGELQTSGTEGAMTKFLQPTGAETLSSLYKPRARAGSEVIVSYVSLGCFIDQ